MSLIKPSISDLMAFQNERGLMTRETEICGYKCVEEITGNYNPACPYESFMYSEFSLMVNEA